MLQFSQYSHYGTVDNLLIFCHLAFQEKIIGFEHLLKSLIAFIKHLAEVRMITNDIHSKGERPLSSNLVSNDIFNNCERAKIWVRKSKMVLEL